MRKLWIVLAAVFLAALPACTTKNNENADKADAMQTQIFKHCQLDVPEGWVASEHSDEGFNIVRISDPSDGDAFISVEYAEFTGGFDDPASDLESLMEAYSAQLGPGAEISGIAMQSIYSDEITLYRGSHDGSLVIVLLSNINAESPNAAAILKSIAFM
ncbi:MAG: hypothetical protein FWG30_05820 [Eubacteriaceae bacterium]|nr:hypothetical protein [Eubacteriaceae bacterium]